MVQKVWSHRVRNYLAWLQLGKEEEKPESERRGTTPESPHDFVQRRMREIAEEQRRKENAMQTTNITDRQVDVQHSAAPVSLAAIPGLGNVVSTFVLAGPCNTNELKLTIFGLQLTTDTPAVVLMQPRQNDNQDFGFPDAFAVMVNTTARDHLLVTIKRLDGNSGWGQNLRLDMLIIDQVNNP